MVENKDMEKLKNTILGKFPLGWSVENLEDNLEKIIDYRGKTPTKAESGVITLSAKSVKMNYIDYSNAYYVSKETYDKFMVRGFPKKGDILMTTEAPLGCIAELNKEDVCVAQRLLTLRGKKEKLLNKYLMYYLQSNIGQHELLSKASGTTVQGIKRTEFSKVNIILPPLETQEKIASILSALDDKIEINNEMNKTLEEMAQTLFKRWFIDFDFPNENGEPYRSSGGKMVDSELGEIPEGWEVGNFENIGIIASGGTPSKSNEEYYTKNGIPWITPKDLSLNKNKFITKGSLDITEKGLAKSSTKLLPKGTVLFSSRAPIGYLAIAEVNVTTNQGFKSIIPNNSENTEFIYQLLKEITPHIESIAGGSTFKEISSQGMKSINITIPSDLILKKYFEITKSFNKKIQNLEKEIQSLTQIRDTLLPKLMSGEIEV